MAIRVPTVEGLPGDKLAAFAPTTIGIFKILESTRKISPEGYALWHEAARLLS